QCKLRKKADVSATVAAADRGGRFCINVDPQPMSVTPNPLALIAEITHRCPLHCVYCSNPLELTSRKEELATADWLRVFGEAAALGVLHLHLTGGEPLARPDLAELIKGARQSRLYTNLITSGIGLS